MYNKYFKDKNVLITGVGGFVGSHLAQRLIILGANVYGISKTKIQTQRNIKNIETNIVNYSIVDNFIKESKINICFHLAGESLVESGQKDPYHTYKVNIEGTLNVLESARKNKLEKIIVASTSHVYGQNKLPYYEGYTPRPTRPYETSKACTDLIAQSYANSFSLPVLIPRFVNIYGPGDLNFTRLIPKTIKAVLLDKSPLMWGGSAVRDYIYIGDAIDAYIQLASVGVRNARDNCIFNFGGGNEISVRGLMEMIISLSGKKLSIEKAKEERSGEIQAQYVSFNKATKLLGWQPKTSLEQGLRETLSWYRKYFA